MGIDGRQYLEIRGPKAVLDTIENTGAALVEGNENIRIISNRFFGPENVEIRHRSDRYLVLSYEFRNRDVYEYLLQLLMTYPKCWIKNDYKTEDGDCGLWTARMRDGAPVIQELTWVELSVEEILHVEDFSESQGAFVADEADEADEVEEADEEVVAVGAVPKRAITAAKA